MTSIVGSGTIRTLADIGLKTNFQDGTLTIDSGRLGTALASNPQAINQIFSDPTTGIGAAAQTLSDRYTNVVDGLFTNSTKTLNTRIKQMDTQADQHADARRRVQGQPDRAVHGHGADRQPAQDHRQLPDPAVDARRQEPVNPRPRRNSCSRFASTRRPRTRRRRRSG